MGLLSSWWQRITQEAPPPALADTEVISDLVRLIREHHRIDLKVARTHRVYQSILLHVNYEDEVLVMDEPFPKDRESLVAGDTIEVSAHGKDFALNFVTQVLNPVIINGMPGFKINLPDTIFNHQKRQDFRVSVSEKDGLTLGIELNEEHFLNCRVVNLSFNGMRFSIEGDQSSFIKPSLTYEKCMLQFESGEEIPCTIFIKNVELVQASTLLTIVGAKFSKLDPRDKAKLDKFIAAIQRRQRRQELRL